MNRQKNTTIWEACRIRDKKQQTDKGTKGVNMYIWGESDQGVRCWWADRQGRTGEGN